MSETTESQSRRGRHDLLEEYGPEAAFGLLVVAGVLFFLSSTTSDTVQLPGIAFGWKLGLEIIRAAIVFGVVAAIVMVLVRGFGGMWPSSLSTSGLSYEQADAIAELVEILGELDTVRVELRTSG
jgi:hypothetical protein